MRVSIFGITLLLAIMLSPAKSNDILAEAQTLHDNGIITNTYSNTYRFENLFSNIKQASFSNTFSNILQTLFSVPNTVGYDTLKSTIALFVVIDPIGTVPLFIALTEKMGTKERKAVSKTAIITSGVLLVLFAVAGTQILAIFGITIFSFMIAGGILLFIVAIELLTHGIWRFGASGGNLTTGESGVVPLAFPLLAGPGAITSVIISFQTAGLIVTILSIAIVIGITYVILQSINSIYRLLGRRGSMIITRVFAVFIAAIAIQYIIEGVKRLFI
jgi:multiple antibiotic resistance protein